MQRWFVLVHVIGVVVFVGAHGVSMWTAFRLRAERERAAIISDLAASESAVGATYGGLLLLALGGFAAAGAGNYWTQGWLLASIVVLLAALVLMYAVASPYYRRIRIAASGDPAHGVEPVSDVELRTMLSSRRPEVLGLLGLVALFVILWLMVVRPGLP